MSSGIDWNSILSSAAEGIGSLLLIGILIGWLKLDIIRLGKNLMTTMTTMTTKEELAELRDTQVQQGKQLERIEGILLVRIGAVPVGEGKPASGQKREPAAALEAPPPRRTKKT